APGAFEIEAEWIEALARGNPALEKKDRHRQSVLAFAEMLSELGGDPVRVLSAAVVEAVAKARKRSRGRPRSPGVPAREEVREFLDWLARRLSGKTLEAFTHDESDAIHLTNFLRLTRYDR